jgi:hypothetical protein
MIFSVFDQENLEKPTDIDKIGTLEVINYEYEYNSLENKYSASLRYLNFHTCTTDDIN